MKGKKLTYLLIVCVVGVWAIIFYRIYAGMSEEEKPMAINEGKDKQEYFKLVNHETDQVTLDLNYRDPFSSVSWTVDVPVKDIKTQHEIKAPIVPKPLVNWSVIQYSGYIFNPVTKQKIAIIQVSGKEALLSEGQSMHGLKLVKYAGDSVKVQYQNSTKYITLK